MRFVISEHAKETFAERAISVQDVKLVVLKPDQILALRSGRKIYQSKLIRRGKLFLLRVIVDDIGSHEAVVVTAYYTSRIAKYWSRH